MKKKTSQVKKNFATALLTVYNAMPTFITIVAVIAIIVYLATYFEVTNRKWYLPLLAGVTGVTALILPARAKFAQPLWSIVSTGITLFVMQLLPECAMMLPVIGVLIYLVAIISEVCVHGSSNLNWGDFVFNIIVSGISTLIIYHFENNLVTTIVLIIAYLITLIVDFNFQFSIKRATPKVKVEKEIPCEQNNDNKPESSDVFITPLDDYTDIQS